MNRNLTFMPALAVCFLLAFGCERHPDNAPQASAIEPAFSAQIELLDVRGIAVARGTLTLETRPGDLADGDVCAGAWEFKEVVPSTTARRGSGVIGSGMLRASRTGDTLAVDLNPGVVDLNHELEFTMHDAALGEAVWEFTTDAGSETLGACVPFTGRREARVPATVLTPPKEPAMTVSELIIEDIVVGDGAECPPGAIVNVHYRGTLMDGTEFDSSYSRGQPIKFPLDNLIQGWKEGIPGMKVGGKRKLTVPFAKAYGERGAPPSIPPRADLVFEIELLGVQ